MSDLENPLSRLRRDRLRQRALGLALNGSIGLACAGVALAIGWGLADETTFWIDRALGLVGLAAFAAFAAIQFAPVVRAFIRLDLE